MSEDLNREQLAPNPNSGRPVWEMVIEDMQARDLAGRAKYGVPLQAGNGRDALLDAYQESLDQTVYLRQAIEELPKAQARVKASDLFDAITYVIWCYWNYWACRGRKGPALPPLPGHIKVFMDWLGEQGFYFDLEDGKAKEIPDHA